jgi:hypothetical protein
MTPEVIDARPRRAEAAAMQLTTAIPGAGTGLLPFALRLDAAVSGANGVVYLAAAGALHDGLGVSEAALRGVGAFFLVFAASVWAISRAPRRTAVRVVAVGNVLYAVECVALLALGVLDDPTALGATWVVAQALVVAGFGALQLTGLRRTERAAG